MALKFKLINRTLSIKGVKKPVYYAQSTASGVTSKEQVIALVEKISAVSSGDVKSVLDTLSTILALEMKAGRIVDLGDLGRFRMSARSKATEKEEEFTQKNLLRPRVLFVPGKEIMRARQEARYELNPLTTTTKKKPNEGETSNPSTGGGSKPKDPSAGGDEDESSF